MAGRSAWKGPFFRLSLLNAIKKQQNALPEKRKSILTNSRNSTIIPSMVGAILGVHNGKDHVPLVVREEMVGYKIGQFVSTRKPFFYRHTNANKKPVAVK